MPQIVIYSTCARDRQRCVSCLHAIQRAQARTADHALSHAEFQRLGAPTSLILTGSHICIGTQSGAVLGVPKASAQRGSADFTVELKPPAGVGRLLTSLFARCNWPLHIFFSHTPASMGSKKLEHHLGLMLYGA